MIQNKMEIKEKVKREVEEEVTKEMLCDNCKKIIECPHTCGFGAEYHLSDAWCRQCGGRGWDFCSDDCLKEFVNNKLKSGRRKEKETAEVQD